MNATTASFQQEIDAVALPVPVGGLHNGFLHKSATSTRLSSNMFWSIACLILRVRSEDSGASTINVSERYRTDPAATPLPSYFDIYTIVL